MSDATRPFLVVYVAWHPGFDQGATIAQAIRRHFRRELYENVAGGTGLSVIFRSLPPPGDAAPLEIDVDEAHATAIVILADTVLAADPQWIAYARALEEQAEAAGLHVRTFPVSMDSAVLAPLNMTEQALRWDRWDGDSTARTKRLLSELTYEFCRMLRHFLERLQGCPPSLNPSSGRSRRARRHDTRAIEGETMNILGLNYIFHDSSACLVSDGTLEIAIEEERLTGDKHSQRFPEHAIRRCLQMTGRTPADVDHIAVSFNPRKNRLEKALYALSLTTEARSFIHYEFLRLRDRQAAFRAWYGKTWAHAKRRPRVHFVDHHLSHIGGSYFVSPFDEAALLSVDGWGEWSTTWMGFAKGATLRQIGGSHFPHSLGCFYTAATEFCGFKPNYDEGKTMGLAPLGDPERFYEDVDALVSIGREGQVVLDLSLFEFQKTNGRFCSPAFHQKFGAPRASGEPIQQHHQDVAAAFQKVLEERLLALCRHLEKRSTSRNLVLAGGVALNSVANGRILRETTFEDIYVMPGAGDNGTCIGAAYQVYNGVLGQPRRFHHDHPYIGTGYSSEAIEKTLRQAKIDYRRSSNVCADVAQLLHQGRIVAWFQGQMEFGPRALGGRSILADPTHPGMKDKINAEVKHREAYRPFAPSVPLEDASRYFDFDGESPFMLIVCDVKAEYRHLLPSITHVDGTARLQTVAQGGNDRYYRLLKEFEKLSNVPVLLNTSFNIMDQPIVESPVNALRCFFSTGLDVLAIGDFIIEKSPQPRRAEPARAAAHAAPLEGTLN